MAREESNDTPRRNPASTSSEQTPLLPPSPPAVGGRPDEGSQRMMNLNGALNTTEQRRVSNAKSQPDQDIQFAASQPVSRLRAVFVSFALGCLVFMVATNMSMLTTTQGAVASELDAFEETSWFTSTYLITMSSLGPLSGKLSVVFSPRLCIFVASIIMAVGSLMCALATTLEAFLIGRAVGGIGASGIFTISIIIVLELTGSKRKGIATGTLNSGYTVGVAVGATAAGGLLHITGWRALFWMQAPVVILAGFIILFAIPADFTSGKKDIEDSDRSTWERIKRIDYLGAVTLTTSLVLMLFSLSSPKTIPILPLVLSVIVAAVFVLIEIYLAYDPVIPVSLLKSRGLLLTCLGTIGFMMARWTVLFYTPTYAIGARQWSASAGGSLLIPTNAGFAAGSLLVGWLHIRRQGSFYLPTLINYALFPLTLLLMAILSHKEGSPAAFVIVLFICGFATGAALNYNLAHILHLTHKSDHYVALALIATFRGYSGSFGSAIGGGIFTRTLSQSLRAQFEEHGLKRDDLITRLLGSPELVGRLTGVEREVAKRGYEDATKFLWLAAALLAFVTCFVQAGVGWQGYNERLDVEEERQALLRNDGARDREEGTANTA